MSEEHYDPVRDRIGVYYKYASSDYRKECEKSCCGGYHAHWWEAHHVLPGTVFSDLEDFIKQCLGITNYNINKPYSMGGLPQLNAYILYFQKRDVEYDASKENLKHMERWSTLGRIKAMKKTQVRFPDYPVHNPVSFGHTLYNEEVDEYLDNKIWDKIREKKENNQHWKPENVRQKLVKTKDRFWNLLKNRKNIPGGGGIIGIKENFENRYGNAKNGWWKPMCMTDVPAEPRS
jgi:hypothetical protein